MDSLKQVTNLVKSENQPSAQTKNNIGQYIRRRHNAVYDFSWYTSQKTWIIPQPQTKEQRKLWANPMEIHFSLKLYTDVGDNLKCSSHHNSQYDGSCNSNTAVKHTLMNEELKCD